MAGERYYWDANAFLGFLKEGKGRVEMCRQVLEAGERGEIQIITSSLTLVEVVHIKGRIRMDADDEEKMRAMFEKRYLILMDVNRRISESARQLIWQDSIKITA